MELPAHKWLLKKSASSQDVALLLTPVDGKCFELQQKLKQQKERKKGTKDSEKVLVSEAKAKAKSKAKAKTSASAKAKPKAAASQRDEGVVHDPTTTEAQITLDILDGLLTRDKYFLDCLVLGMRSAFTLARERFGALQEVQLESTDLLCFDVVAEEFPDDIFTYNLAEAQLLRFAATKAITFAITGEVTLGGKAHKRWSSLRPALQAQVISLYKKARDKGPGTMNLFQLVGPHESHEWYNK